MSVLVETSFGDLVLDLNTQKCPNACFNFLKLCKLKHYNNSLFFKVQKDYLTQIKTKQPTTIWHQMGQSKQFFSDEIDLQGKINSLGLVATSNSGFNKNNSQFFITLTKANLSSLKGKHTVFGQVQQGLDVLKKLNETFVDETNRPKMNIRILHTHVLQDPFDDPNDLKQPESPQLQRQKGRLQALEHLEMKQKYETEQQIEEKIKKVKAQQKARALELIGQLPDANVKPPQNILFVCKLNPITQEKDLQIIFSRFGPVKSVQIVRDWKTGQSLQYGFIEFESQKSCEQAYLKMENVMIDDRRIHVDFSQSVSKLMPKMKNKNEKFRKSGENRQKMKELIPKMKEGKGFYGDDKYNFVAKDKNPQRERGYQQIQKERVYQERREEERYREQRQRQEKDLRRRQRQEREERQQREYRQYREERRKEKHKKEKKERHRSPSNEQRKSRSWRSRSRSQGKHKKKHKSKHKKHRHD